MTSYQNDIMDMLKGDTPQAKYEFLKSVLSERGNMIKDILSKQREIISSPIRFNGVHILDIEQVAINYGVDLRINL